MVPRSYVIWCHIPLWTNKYFTRQEILLRNQTTPRPELLANHVHAPISYNPFTDGTGTFASYTDLIRRIIYPPPFRTSQSKRHRPNPARTIKRIRYHIPIQLLKEPGSNRPASQYSQPAPPAPRSTPTSHCGPKYWSILGRPCPCCSMR